jgi:hypothetical protein
MNIFFLNKAVTTTKLKINISECEKNLRGTDIEARINSIYSAKAAVD